jgi:hypothetical protein
MQHLIVRADINAAVPIPTKVAARQGSIVAFGSITDRDVRRDFAAD